MAKPMFLRKIKNRLIYVMARLVAGEPSGQYMAFVGKASCARLCERIIELGHTSVLVVTDKALRDLGLADEAVAGLNREGVTLSWYDQVDPDPTYGHVEAGARILRESGATAIVAVGGGSSIDCAKVIALTKHNAGDDMTSWAGFGKAPDEAAPLFVIPTTSGTGSEATMGAVITNQATHKKEIISGSSIHPAAVALDACLMVGLPKPITAATGIDALTHGIEAYISTWERGNRTEMGRISVQGVFRWLRQACEDPGNMDAREGMALAAYNAGVAINQVNVGNVHAIAHQLGANFGIPHGHANAIVLPHVLTLYGETAVERLAELAVATGVSDSGHPETRARAFIAEVEKLIADVGIAPTDPRIKREKFDVIAEAAMDEGDGYFCPRQLEKSEILNLLEAISE